MNVTNFDKKFSIFKHCIFIELRTHISSRVHIWMGTTHADESRGRMYGTFVHCLAIAKEANRPYINILYANSLWCTDSWQIAFSCSPNVFRTGECRLPRIGNTSTLNNGFVFACCIRACVPFAFKCKPGFKWTPNEHSSANFVCLLKEVR